METKTDQLIFEMQKMQSLFVAFANSVLTEEQKKKFIDLVEQSGFVTIRKDEQ